MHSAATLSTQCAQRDPFAVKRLDYLDHLKVFLTVLVVLHHAGQAYGPTGGSWPVSHAEKAKVLGPFFHVNASFFMGLFFLISGYFLPPAFDRKGGGSFLKERFQRLGIPILCFGLGIFPFLGALRDSAGGEPFLKAWLNELSHFQWAHLWFLGHLLVYGLIYAVWRRFWNRPESGREMKPFPATWVILAYVGLLAVVSGLVRLKYPIDRWVTVVVPAELAHFPQYCSLFWLGVLAWHHHWLERIPPVVGRCWLGVGCAAVGARFWYWAAHARFLRGSHWGDMTWLVWESLLCVGLCIGLVYWFQQHLNAVTPFGRFCSRNAYGVYVLHLPVLVIFQCLVENTGFGPLTLTALTATLTLIVCYGLTALLRCVPGVSRVL